MKRFIPLVVFVALVVSSCGGGGGAKRSSGGAPGPGPGGTPNNPPVITSTAPTTAQVGLLYTYLLMATDSDLNALTFALIDRPTGMEIDAASGAISWTPSPAQTGTGSIRASVTDGIDTVQQTWAITVTNPGAGGGTNTAPVIVSTPPVAGQVGTAYTYTVSATDGDGDTLTYQLTTKPAGMTIDPTTGAISWMPGAGQAGVVTVTVVVSDGTTTTEQTWSITVSAPPQGGGGGGGATGSGGTGGTTGFGSGTIELVQTMGAGQMATYQYFVPSSYNPSTPMPLIIALHGQGGVASQTCGDWANLATSEGFMVAAPQALAAQSGTWVGGVCDEMVIETLNSMAGQFNVHLKKTYLWGYSAGAHMSYRLGIYFGPFFAACSGAAGTLQFALQAGTLAFQGGGYRSFQYDGTQQGTSAGRKAKVVIVIGTLDPNYQALSPTLEGTMLTQAGHANQVIERVGQGHIYTPADLQAAWNGMKTVSLP